MKKTFVTLATVAALVAAAAPVATTLANGPFGTVDTTVDAKAAQISRDYQIQLGKVELLQAEDARVWEELAAAQSSLVNAQSAVDAGQTQFVAAQRQADNLIQQAKQGSYATPEEATVALKEAEELGSILLKQAGDALDLAKNNLVAEQNRVATIQESANASRAALTEAQAVLAKLAEQLNGTPAAPDAGAAAPAGNAPATNGAAPAGNGAAAPAGNGAAANNGKAAAKTVAAAKTETGAKTLPKTSAAK
ncbi:TPA: hypothetical protein U2B37_000027 [Streptococcus suis]|nr:hypothetical protein [Streptococcus suis]HEM6301976.1 hypothetical protein [Streptococcus suis]